MKAKYLLILAAAAGLFSSCDMDLPPVGYIEDQTALQSLNDVQSYRNGFYSGMRSFASSKFLTLSDIQCDMFNGLVINGNRCGSIANGDILAGDSDITSYWLSLYTMIGNTNFFLEKMDALLEEAIASGDVEKELKYKRFIGEAHFFRGFYYAMMFDRWCQVYDSSIGDTPGLGLPIVTKWDPSPDRATYPGRSTMNETIKFFRNELQLAYDAMAEYQEIDIDEIVVHDAKAPAPYISTWAIRTMQARIALWLGEYDNALSLAEDVINNGGYTLCTTSNYSTMWTKDEGSEIIFRPYMTNQELGNSIGATWLTTQITSADYIPTPQLIAQLLEHGLNKLKKPNDCRYTAYLTDRSLQTAFGDVSTPCFYKFPGNDVLKVSSNENVMNMPKTFRLSELYFIAMESAAEKGEEAIANKYLGDYMKNRIIGYTHTDLSGETLKEEIRKQRGIELAGEGFRLSDLRRWHKGFSRSSGSNYESNPDVSVILTKAGLTVTYQPDDYRYTWPIPDDELQSNPQMRGQQNPGYGSN